MYKTKSGFTIVELLIVIVVIGILAAITIVAYNGIQTRAENTKTANGLAAYARALALYAADNGTYPSTATYPCLGNPSSGVCGRISGPGSCPYTGYTTVDTTFDNALAPYLGSTKPSLSDQTMSCGGDQFRGVHANHNAGDPKNLSFKAFFKGSGVCPSVGSLTAAVREQSDQTVYCFYQMPSL